MKFRLTVLIVFSLCLSNVFADEGMWLLGNLRKNKQTDRVMKELGLQMPVNKIYNPKKPSLSDAVVSFGGFCSGVVVSEDGLVFTNHHCGFSSIQQHSSVEHDYLKDGFFARSLDEELPNPELYVRFLLRTEDVTKRVLSAARYAKTETERRVAVDSIMNVIGLEVSEKDSIWFSYLNKPTIKFPVLKIANPMSFDISLQVNVPVMKEVKLKLKNYRQDSIQNRRDYAKIFNYEKPGLKTVTPSYGGAAGFDLDEIINMFRFKRNRSMASFQKRLFQEEEDNFVSHRFSKALVRRLTLLDGNELFKFIENNNNY